MSDHLHNKRAADLSVLVLSQTSSFNFPAFHFLKTPHIWNLSSSPLWLRLLSVTDIGNKKCQYLSACACATAVLSNFYPVKLPLNHKDINMSFQKAVRLSSLTPPTQNEDAAAAVSTGAALSAAKERIYIEKVLQDL